MSERRPYRRPMNPTWWANPPYRAYTLRELTGVAVALYGLVLFFGLICLALGPGAYDGYLGFLRSPFSIVLHLLLLAAVVYHVVTWFETLPKTQPKLIIDGKPFPAKKMTAIAIKVGAGCSLVLLLFTIWVGR